MKRSCLTNKFVNTRNDLDRKVKKNIAILILTFQPKKGLSGKLLSPF